MTGNQTFKTACGGVEFQGGARPITASDFGEGVSQGRSLDIAFVGSTSTWNITGPAFTTSFGPSDLSATPPANTVLYQRTNFVGGTDRFAIAARPFGTQPAEYVRGSRLFIVPATGRTLDFWCVFGVPTVLSDSRPASTITFTSFNIGGSISAVSSTGLTQFDLGDSTVTLTSNPTTGAVTTRLTLVGRQFTPSGLSTTQTQFGTYDGVATVNGTTDTFRNRLTSSSKVSVDSNFGGWFFGPQGLEAGFAFNIAVDEPDGTRLLGAGAVTARR